MSTYEEFANAAIGRSQELHSNNEPDVAGAIALMTGQLCEVFDKQPIDGETIDALKGCPVSYQDDAIFEKAKAELLALVPKSLS